jgi:hypothetical protein
VLIVVPDLNLPEIKFIIDLEQLMEQIPENLDYIVPEDVKFLVLSIINQSDLRVLKLLLPGKYSLNLDKWSY